MGSNNYAYEKSFTFKAMLGRAPTVEWSRPRVAVASVIQHQHFDLAIGALILFNVGLMIVEADKNATCETDACAPPTVVFLNNLLLGVYTIEMLAGIYVFRLQYLVGIWNYLDMFIVVFGWTDYFLTLAGMSNEIPNFQMLRIMRVVRLMRAARLLRFFPELYVMIRGFFCAMKAMFWGFVMIMVLLVVWSLVAVEIIYPEAKELDWGENEWCALAFSSVWHSTLIFFQTLVAGDAWGTCAIPIIQKSPYVFLVFAGSLVCVSLGFTNLILAVIVDTAAAARELDLEEQLSAKRKQEEEGIRRWEDMIRMVDADGNGQITREELMEGYDQFSEIRDTLTMLDISRSDLEMLFNLMDDDQSGTLSYDEFINAIQRAHAQDMRMYLMVMKLEVSQLNRAMLMQQQQLDKMSEAMNVPKSDKLRASRRVSRARISSFERELAFKQSQSERPSQNGNSGRPSETAPALESPHMGRPTPDEPRPHLPKTPVVPTIAGLLARENSGDMAPGMRAMMTSESVKAKQHVVTYEKPVTMAASLDEEFRRLRQSLDQRFEELVRNVGQNTDTLQRHTKVLEATMESRFCDETPRRGSERAVCCEIASPSCEPVRVLKQPDAQSALASSDSSAQAYGSSTSNQDAIRRAAQAERSAAAAGAGDQAVKDIYAVKGC